MLIFSIVSFKTLFFEVIGYFIHTSLEIPLSDPLFSLYLIFCCLTNISGLGNLFNGSFVSPSWLFITIANRVQLRADAFEVCSCHVLSRRLFNFLFFLVFLKLNFWSQFKGWILTERDDHFPSCQISWKRHDKSGLRAVQCWKTRNIFLWARGLFTVFPARAKAGVFERGFSDICFILNYL